MRDNRHHRLARRVHHARHGRDARPAGDSAQDATARRLLSTGAGGDVVCAMDTGKNCGTLAAVLAGKVVGLGGDMAAPSRSRASLRQPCTIFAFTPCDIATLATDAPGAAHCSSTNAFNSALCRRRKTTLSAVIVST